MFVVVLFSLLFFLSPSSSLSPSHSVSIDLLVQSLVCSFVRSLTHSRRRTFSLYLWLCDLLQNRISQYFNQANSTTNKNKAITWTIQCCAIRSQCVMKENRKFVESKIEYTLCSPYARCRVKWSTDLYFLLLDVFIVVGLLETDTYTDTLLSFKR